jgi:shikimate kinase
MKHVVLVGLPGSGKTTVGRAVAAKTGLPFLDFDEEITRRTGLTPSEFFFAKGEQAFRQKELELSRDLVGRHTIVVAPGGGWITQQAAREVVREQAVLVYLRVSAAEAVARMGGSVQLRPLLTSGSPLEALQALLDERGPLYEQADFVVDTEVIDLQGVIDRVAEVAVGVRGSAG